MVDQPQLHDLVSQNNTFIKFCLRTWAYTPSVCPSCSLACHLATCAYFIIAFYTLDTSPILQSPFRLLWKALLQKVSPVWIKLLSHRAPVYRRPVRFYKTWPCLVFFPTSGRSNIKARLLMTSSLDNHTSIRTRKP